MELVLYYSTGDARMKKQEMMMKSVLVRMGVKIRNVAPDQVLESVGYLAGVPGFEKREVSETLETEEKLPEITEPMLVMRDFTGRRIDWRSTASSLSALSGWELDLRFGII